MSTTATKNSKNSDTILSHSFFSFLLKLLKPGMLRCDSLYIILTMGYNYPDFCDNCTELILILHEVKRSFLDVLN